MDSYFDDAERRLFKGISPEEQLQRINADLTSQAEATESRKCLCSFGDWCGTGVSSPTPMSIRAWMHLWSGYKLFAKRFGNDEFAVAMMRASADTVLELKSMLSYPSHHGHGTLLLKQLCRIADEHKVDIWLDTLPFGPKPIDMPLKKIRRFYRRFGFEDQKTVCAEWLCGADSTPRSNVMLRRCGRVEVR